MDEDEAIEGLKRLGLTAYEARVFLGLQKLGNGTASEVSDVVDVPRSQVYGAAENLEEKGLVDIQQSTPTVYRPISLDSARTRLLDQLAETGSRTFDYLETIQETEAPEEERSEALWLVRGTESVNSRAAEIIEAAEERVLYAASEVSMLDDEILDALTVAAENGAAVLIASSNDTVREAVGSRFETCPVPPNRSPTAGGSRVVLVDDETMLLSVCSSADTTDGTEEVAFWSSETTFAVVLGGFLREWFTEPAQADDT